MTAPSLAQIDAGLETVMRGRVPNGITPLPLPERVALVQFLISDRHRQACYGIPAEHVIAWRLTLIHKESVQ